MKQKWSLDCYRSFRVFQSLFNLLYLFSSWSLILLIFLYLLYVITLFIDFTFLILINFTMSVEFWTFLFYNSDITVKISWINCFHDLLSLFLGLSSCRSLSLFSSPFSTLELFRGIKILLWRDEFLLKIHSAKSFSFLFIHIVPFFDDFGNKFTLS